MSSLEYLKDLFLDQFSLSPTHKDNAASTWQWILSIFMWHANVTQFYCKVNVQEDCTLMQRDIAALEAWLQQK